MKKISLLVSALALVAGVANLNAMRYDRYGKTGARLTPAERVTKANQRINHWKDTIKYAKKAGASKEYMAWADSNLSRAETHLKNVKGFQARVPELKRRWSQASPATKARVAAARQRFGSSTPVRAASTTTKKSYRGGLAKSRVYGEAYRKDVAAKKAGTLTTTEKPKTWTERLFGTKK